MIRGIDTETTGLSGPAIEVALAGPEPWVSYIHVSMRIEPAALRVHGIPQAVADTGLTEAQVARQLVERIHEGDILVAHNAPFDKRRISGIFSRAGIPMPKVTWIDTLVLARALVPGLPSYKLGDLIARFGLAPSGHRAMADANAALALYNYLRGLPTAKPVAVPVAAPAPKHVDSVAIVKAAVVWKCWYQGMKDEVPYQRTFTVASVDFRAGWFVAIDLVANGERRFKFDRFEHVQCADYIIAVMAI